MGIWRQGLWFMFDICLECYMPIALLGIHGKIGPGIAGLEHIFQDVRI